jgi:hypothetical protein
MVEVKASSLTLGPALLVVVGTDVAVVSASGVGRAIQVSAGALYDLAIHLVVMDVGVLFHTPRRITRGVNPDSKILRVVVKGPIRFLA